MAGEAIAVPLPGGLAISGSVELSTSIGQAPFSDGSVSQTGEVRRIVGGTTTSSGFSTTPGTADGANDNATSLPATNPLTGAFTRAMASATAPI